MPRTRTGSERLLANLPRRFRHARVGVLCHNASRLPDGTHIVTALKNSGVRVLSLFAPEHGIWGTHQDLEPLTSRLPKDPLLRLPIIPLYGPTAESLSPDPRHLLNLDAVIVDLQDVGARYYTFIWTLAKLMEVATRTRTPVWVLDRPNPIDGITLEGPLVNPQFRSFVGLYSLPVRHGLTIGEVALWLAGNFPEFEGLSLKVVPMAGWRRRYHWRQTGLPWFHPSPNMPAPETALVYPGMCLLEGTNISEGRGTTRPFEMFGAPWIEPDALISRVGTTEGARLLPAAFKPTSNKYARKICYGALWHITHPPRWSPFLAGLKVLSALLALYPDRFRWRDPPYEYEREKLPIDILLGDPRLREALEGGSPPDDLPAMWQKDLSAFANSRKPFLLYPE
jgi:uncharacterized protein YbbC (DUF1343 family)